jgi:Leucine-rich repeat (LRR) protein
MSSFVLEAIHRWVTDGNPNALLDISMFSLYEVPSLPTNVRKLDISSNNISKIRASDLPDSLTELTCKYNGLETIEKLPPNLMMLDCTWNRLKTLPDIPASLELLCCNHNQLRALPEPPPLSKLNTLLCGNNRLMYLPNVETLGCLGAEFNSICVFPKCGPNMYFLGLGYNCIEIVPEKLPPGITEIVLTRNNIKTIDHVRFPAGLKKLSISENPILNLPADLPDSIHTLHCDQMRLAGLPETLPTSLSSFNCSYNHITELPDTILDRCPKLELLWCNGTHLLRDKTNCLLTKPFIHEVLRLQRLQSKQRIVGRTKFYKEELMQVLWHPQRLERMWFSKGLDFENVLYCGD